MDILKALEGIDLNDEQIAALDKFFEEYKNKISADVKKQYSEGVDTEQYVLKADADKAFAMFEADCEKAFDLFEKDAERAFELFEEDAEAAFNLGVEDVQKTYTENMAQALQEIYDEVNERVKKDFLESKEYKTIQKLKDLIVPLLEDTDHDLVAKIKELSEEKEQVEIQNKELAKDKAIATLLKDIPAEYTETVKNFISAGKDEDDVIERFNSIVEMIETKLSTPEQTSVAGEKRFARKETKKEETTPVTEEKQTIIKKDKEDAKPVFSSVFEEAAQKESEVQPFDNKFSAIIDKVFAN